MTSTSDLTEPETQPERNTAMTATPEPITNLNLAVVRGEVSSTPDVRVLPSDAVLVQLQVTTRLDAETLSTPIAFWNPPAWVQELEAGTEIVVVGRIRRRFFRAGGATASRVELEADVVARATDKRRVQAALRRVTSALAVLAE